MKIRLNSKFVLIYDGKHGVETHVLTLANSLRRRGLNLKVISLRTISGDKVTVAAVLRFFANLVLGFIIATKLVWELKRERAVVVHVHSPRIPLLMGYFIHVLNRVPLIFTIHEEFSFGLLLNRLYTKATKVISISTRHKTVIQKYGVAEDKIVVIPNMVDTDLFSPSKIELKPETPASICSLKLLALGRLDLRKEPLTKTAMELMPRIVSAFPETQLLVVGGGPRIEYFREMALKINQRVGKDVVIVTGPVPNQILPEFLKEADVVIGVERCAIEAMSCSKPVIVASPGADFVFTGALVTKETALDLYETNFSGRGYREKIDHERLYHIIMKLLGNEEYRNRVGIESRLFVKENLAASVIAKKIESEYLDSLKITQRQISE